MWRTEKQMNKSPYCSMEQWLYLAAIKTKFTVIMQHKEATGAEVAVELDQYLISGGGHALLYRVPAELANLRRGLVGSIPGRETDRGGNGGGWGERERAIQRVKGGGGQRERDLWINTSNNFKE